MKRRAVSAPYWSISACGSTPLFFDFDMVPMPPTSPPAGRRPQRGAGGRPRSSRDGVDFVGAKYLMPPLPVSSR
jgi:hypothetical protein